MKIKSLAGFVSLFIIFGFCSAVQAVPISHADFDSSALEFVFPEPGPFPINTVTTNDFTVSEGKALESDGYHTEGHILIDFTYDISALGMDITRWKSSSISMSVYDSADNLLENNVFTVSTYPDFIGLDVGANNISYALINIGDDTWIDNLIYQSENTTAPVPEPATMILLGTGLVGLIASRVSRKTA